MVNRRIILRNIGASSITSIINFLFQLISIPLFMKYWGIELYGEWIVLNALTAYFAMSDIGLNTVTTNEFSINYKQKKYRKCNVLFNNNLFFIIPIFAFIFLGIIALNVFGDLSKLLNFNLISEEIAEFGLFSLILHILFVMVSNLYNSLYRATHNYSRSINIDNIVRVLEYSTLMIAVILNFSLFIIFILYPLPRFLGLIFKIIDTKKIFRLKIGLIFFNWSELKKLFVPSLSFLSFPIGHSIILQGFILLINFTMGSSAVVIYSTMRTLINVVKSGFTVLNNSFWPEYSLAYGANDKDSMRKMHRFSVGISFYFSFFIVNFLLIFGKWIYETWTNHEIEFNSILFYLFLITLFTSTFWSASSTVLISTNNHKTYSIIYLISTFISISIAYLILTFFNSISYLPLALLIIDVLLIHAVLRQTLKILDEDINEFLKSFLIEPILSIKSFFLNS